MKYTKQELLSLNPCRAGHAFAKSCDFDVVKIYNTCPRGDWLIWLLRRTKLIEKRSAVLLAMYAFAAFGAARTNARQWQAAKIRELIPCPFEN